MMLSYCMSGYSQTTLTPGTWNGYNPSAQSPTNTSTCSESNAVGIGTSNPKAWLEINYCPDQDKGLLILKNNSCKLNPWDNFEDINDVYFPILPSQIGHLFSTSPEWQEPILDLTYHQNLTMPTFTTGAGTTFLINPTPQPLLIAKTYDPLNSALDGTRFLVTPYGNTGINMPSPRVSLDVRGKSAYNTPTAIFGINSNNTTGSNFTKHIQLVSNLSNGGFNNISQNFDQGIFFTDGLGSNGSNSNLNAGFIIAPWGSNGHGGLRMEANGNTELRGNLRVTKLVVNAQWWPDFVFHSNYKLMPLSEVAKFINTKHHLPGMPSQDSVMNSGQDVGELQKLQQQKIEELTLYTIQQDEQLKAQEAALQEQKAKLEALEAKLNAILNK
ncbi:MAG: hypothetical protein Q8K70_02095 [Bacteroidota bacterium]|nr:hypothetical protein [Bacteroidota bacterium]